MQSFANIAIIGAVLGSIVLLLQSGNQRLIAIVALIVSGIEALMAFGIMSVAFARFRIDVVLPALLLIAGIVLWARAKEKSGVTAATVVTLVGVAQVINALHILS